MRFRTIFFRSCRLRCPRCGEGRLFYGWFAMHDACDHCGMPFQRGPGFYLGSIYFNYGLTSALALAAFFVLYLGYGVSSQVLMWPLVSFCLLFPLWFFRYARSLWLGMDEYFDPAEEQPEP